MGKEGGGRRGLKGERGEDEEGETEGNEEGKESERGKGRWREEKMEGRETEGNELSRVSKIGKGRWREKATEREAEGQVTKEGEESKRLTGKRKVGGVKRQIVGYEIGRIKYIG